MVNNSIKQGIDNLKLVDLKQGRRVFKDSLTNTNPDDYYQIRLSQRSTLNINLKGLQADADLALLGSKGNTISQSVSSGAQSDAINRDLNPGTYHVRVARGEGNTEYRLNISAASSERTQKVRKAKKVGFAQQVFQLINIERRNAGLLPLKTNPKLVAAAKNHSWDMATNDFFAHIGSNGSSPLDRIRASGYKFSLAAENVAAGQSTPEAVVQAWMNSPGHRANILNAQVREMGIGYYFLANDAGNLTFQHYWTQDFAKPMA
ncbi:pre-peptidase C-terminal domain-containing protein [Oculatella sp. LEGE 06141]|uniref:CAP domain-containing protein n=1 Tax=Oculatella sp. LEGE 06141 TaxID=1828648 RepID=UPI0018804FBB|nr:CAP domain-containing protein [Oculatella sp. LEGE 06141]MBE9181079.1 pre-peptidase C-terminal domain-containing protein [Oculatella sp. LEGE 06141]